MCVCVRNKRDTIDSLKIQGEPVEVSGRAAASGTDGCQEARASPSIAFARSRAHKARKGRERAAGGNQKRKNRKCAASKDNCSSGEAGGKEQRKMGQRKSAS